MYTLIWLYFDVNDVDLCLFDRVYQMNGCSVECTVKLKDVCDPA